MKQGKFHRALKSRHVNLIALGGIIGSSYFLGTGYVLNQIGPGAFLAYALGGLITYMTMVCLAELSILNPAPGSFITFAERFVSKSWASGVGWSYWINWVVYVPSECVAGGILMNRAVPEFSIYFWACAFALLITLINLIHVKAFGELEFWLSIIKLTLIIGFTMFAIGIFFGWIGNTSSSPIGDRYFLKEGGLFPNGITILFVNMVILLSNFQGSEIIGLSAAESENPKKNIPLALKSITYRIVGLYLIPTFLIALIFPWQSSSLTGSVFAIALNQYGFVKIGKIFGFLIIAGALSSANSGLYATIRSIHALSVKGIAPKFLKKINHQGIPINSTFFTLFGMWSVLIFSFFFREHNLYANLLAISGFTGSICWISICLSQLNFRRKMKEELIEKSKKFFQVPFFPMFTYLAIILQVFCLLVVLWTPSLRSAFYLGAPAVLVPMIIQKLRKIKKKRNCKN